MSCPPPLAELRRGVTERFGELALTAPAGGLQGKAGPLLKELCDA